MFKIRVYDKRDHPAEPFLWFFMIGGLILCGVWFLLDEEKSPAPLFILYLAMLLVATGGILRTIVFGHKYKSIGEVSYLTVDEATIHFLDKEVSLYNVYKILIRLDDNQVQNSRNRNNYFEIQTQYGEIYKLGILINGSNDEKQVDGIVEKLKLKVRNLTYENNL